MEATGSSLGTQHSLCARSIIKSSKCLPGGWDCPVPNNVNLGARRSSEGAWLMLGQPISFPSQPQHTLGTVPGTVENIRDPTDGPFNLEGEWKGRLSVLFKNSKCLTPPSSDQARKCSSAPSSPPPSTTGTGSKIRSSLHVRHPSCGTCWVFM